MTELTDPVVTLFAKWEKARDEFKRVAAEQAALGHTAQCKGGPTGCRKPPCRA